MTESNRELPQHSRTAAGHIHTAGTNMSDKAPPWHRVSQALPNSPEQPAQGSSESSGTDQSKRLTRFIFIPQPDLTVSDTSRVELPAQQRKCIAEPAPSTMPLLSERHTESVLNDIHVLVPVFKRFNRLKVLHPWLHHIVTNSSH